MSVMQAMVTYEIRFLLRRVQAVQEAVQEAAVELIKKAALQQDLFGM